MKGKMQMIKHWLVGWLVGWMDYPLIWTTLIDLNRQPADQLSTE